MKIFEKRYDGESLCDLSRDVVEALDSEYNSLLNQIPVDKYGFQKGTFVVTVVWNNES